MTEFRTRLIKFAANKFHTPRTSPFVKIKRISKKDKKRECHGDYNILTPDESAHTSQRPINPYVVEILNVNISF